MSEKPAESKENIWKTLRKPEKLLLKITLNIKSSSGSLEAKHNEMGAGSGPVLYNAIYLIPKCRNVTPFWL